MRMMNRRTFLSSSAALIAAACGGARSARTPRSAERADAAAQALCKRAWVFDGNLVAPLDDEKDLPPEVAAHVRQSGLSAIKQTLGGPAGSYAETKDEIAAYDKAMGVSSGLYLKVEKLADFERARAAGRIGMIYSFEAATMFEGKVERIDEFSQMGVRVMQLSYNLQSPFASGVMVPQPSPGLTELGRQAVARMNALGVTLDVSHCDEPSSLGAIAASSKPVAITHAGCAAVYRHPRNKSDQVLRAIADKGGVVGIYELSFISAPPAQQTLDQYLAHIAHALDVCGEDHVGIGSDALLEPFDVSPEMMKKWDEGKRGAPAARGRGTRGGPAAVRGRAQPPGPLRRDRRRAAAARLPGARGREDPRQQLQARVRRDLARLGRVPPAARISWKNAAPAASGRRCG